MDKSEISAFGAAMGKHAAELLILKVAYLAAQIKEAELVKMFDEAYNEVLCEHEFYVPEGIKHERVGLNPGDRIMNEKHWLLMDDADEEKYNAYALDKLHMRGYVTEDGTYMPGYNGTEIKLNAQNALIDFQISILPKEMRDALKDVKKDYNLTHKFLDIIMGQTGKEET